MPCFNPFTRFYDETEDEDIEQQQQQSAPYTCPIQVRALLLCTKNILYYIGIVLLGICVLIVPGGVAYLIALICEGNAPQVAAIVTIAWFGVITVGVPGYCILEDCYHSAFNEITNE